MNPFNFGAAGRGQFTDWAPKMLRELYPSFSDQLIVKEDIVYQAHPFFSTSSGAKLLIIGGGPSTNDLTLTDLAEYDSIWSINKCYKHPLLKYVVDLIVAGAGVNIQDPDFLKWISIKNPIIGFEIHPHWDAYRKLVKRFYEFNDNVFCVQTRIYDQIGGCVRLINLGAAIGCFSEIYFIGLDGPEAILRGDHAFEPGKTDLPSLCTASNAQKIHQIEYDFFWDYIKELYPKVKFVSLQKNNPLHAKLEETKSDKI